MDRKDARLLPRRTRAGSLCDVSQPASRWPSEVRPSTASEGLAARRAEHVRRLERALEIARERLAALPEVHRVSLFGSHARGRCDLFTDLDLLVVVETGLPLVERLQWIHALLALPVDADVLCYTPEEFERLRGEPFLREALRDEVVLHEKPRG